MKILIAPDAFKGSLSASEVAKAIQKGIQNVDPDIVTLLSPMADGGEGTVQSLIDATDGEIVRCVVHDPLFRKIPSFYGIMGDGVTAVIEMAAASGLPLLTVEERNPLKTTTYGTGELIIDALNKGCLRFIIGLGGSATNDGGCGMAQALGARLLDASGNDIGLGGEELLKITTIDMTTIDVRIKTAIFTAACDVSNVLCGNGGASVVYSKQKGARLNDIITLDKSLAHFAAVAQQQLHIDIINKPGAGAAGGLGAGVMVFLKGSLSKGIDIITKTTQLSEKMNDVDLVITGEGCLDFQTAFGKTPFGIAQLAKQKNIPVVAIAGSLGIRYESLYAIFDGIFSIINQPMTIGDALENAADLVTAATENVLRFWTTAKKR